MTDLVGESQYKEKNIRRSSSNNEVKVVVASQINANDKEEIAGGEHLNLK